MPFDIERKNVTPFFGPVLHFRGRFVDVVQPQRLQRDSVLANQPKITTIWGLRLVVGCDPAKYNANTPPSLTFEGGYDDVRVHKTWRRIDVKVAQKLGYVLWACDFGLELADEGRVIPYTVKLGGMTKNHALHVPGVHEDPHIQYHSCNDNQYPKLRNPSIYLSWRHFNNTHKNAPFDLVIAGGDQIYADQCKDGGFSEDRDKLEEFFLNEYLVRFADEEHMAEALASVPFIMQPDDHDYYNGAGSEGKRECKLARRLAHKFRFMFQLGQAGHEAFNKDKGGEYVESSRVYRVGPNIVVLSMDHRSHRNCHHDKHPLMKTATWAHLKRKVELKVHEDPRYFPRHILVLFAVPLMFMQNDFITQLSEKLKSELRSDFRDSPMSYHNRHQTKEILADLIEIAKSHSIRITYLSGDAHVWGYGEVKSHGKHTPPYELDPAAAHQWISSPMCNDPSIELAQMRPVGNFLAQTKRHLGEVDLKLLKLHPQRNYMRLFTSRRDEDGDVVLHGLWTREDAVGEFLDDVTHLESAPLRLPVFFKRGASSAGGANSVFNPVAGFAPLPPDHILPLGWRDSRRRHVAHADSPHMGPKDEKKKKKAAKIQKCEAHKPAGDTHAEPGAPTKTDKDDRHRNTDSQVKPIDGLKMPPRTDEGVEMPSPTSSNDADAEKGVDRGLKRSDTISSPRNTSPVPRRRETAAR